MTKLGLTLISCFCLSACVFNKVANVNAQTKLLSLHNESSQYQIILVRHFQKQKANAQSGRDVSLNKEGVKNAEKLAKYLAVKLPSLDKIYSTNYKRTMQTANPSSRLFDLPIEHYDPTKLNTLADQLLASKSSHLVVGHSNTTGVLYGLLGCESTELLEQDYGDIFVVTIITEANAAKSTGCERYILE